MAFFTKKTKGAVSIFLVIILVPMLTIASVFVDASRITLSRSILNSAGDLSLNTVLTQYDADLNDFYGMMASAQSIDEFLLIVNDYFETSIASQGIDTTNAKNYANKITGIFTGDTEVDDLLRIELAEEDSFSVTKVENGSLANPALIKTQVVEFMKYRSPINASVDLFNKFTDASDELDDCKDNADLIDKKQKFYETEGELCEIAYEAYSNIKQFSELGITKTYVNDMKTHIASYKQKYKTIHKKIVMDLYNTQGIGKFDQKEIDVSPTANKYSSEEEASASDIEDCLKDVCASLEDYFSKKEAFDNTTFLSYSSSTYDIQYWVQMVDFMKSNHSYSNYYEAANDLCKDFADLENAVDNAEDDALDSEVTLGEYDNVNATGEKTLSEHYSTLSSQFSGVKTNYISASGYKYNVITERLNRISNKAINAGDTKTTSTNTDIEAIYNEINGYYDKVVEGSELLVKAMTALSDLKDKIKEYDEDRETWKDAANKYDSDLAKSDREEIDAIEEGKEYGSVSTDNIDKLNQRVNNINSFLGTLRTGMEETKYNQCLLVTTDTSTTIPLVSYANVKDVSGIEESKIKLLKSELTQYASDSFKFSESDKIETVNITSNNNPDIEKVNEPDLYKWLVKKFKNYNTEKAEQGKKDYKAEKEKGEEEVKDVGTEGTASNNNQINECENLPSDSFEALVDDAKVTSSISKVAKFVSDLFGNFGDTMGKGAINVRDDLYVTDYITSMFSFDTYENEGKYGLLSDAEKKKVDLSNYTSKYSSVKDKWESTEVTDTWNKTLTNKMIDGTYNWSYQNEAEYIMYGGSNAKNKVSAYGSIFMIRFALNLPADFSWYWGMGNAEGREVNGIANGISAATSGVVPAALVKLAICLALTAAESAYDLACLQAGLPVIFVKRAADLSVRLNRTKGTVSTEGKFTMQYSDYLKLLLFIKLLDSDKANGIYARIADVVQVNMSKTITKEAFLMSDAQVYFKLDTTVKVPPLMLKLPLIATEEGNTIGDEDYKLTYSAIKGY